MARRGRLSYCETVPSIVVLESDGLGREHLLELLGAAGHVVTVVETGDEALERWRTARHEVAILAEDAPGLPAAEIAARMKSETPHVFAPVLLITPHANDVGARVAGLSIADDVVSRPFWPEEVLARVEALLRTRQLIDQLRVARAELEARAVSDSATGLRSRAFLLERLQEEWKRAQRYNEPLTLTVIGIEGLSAIESKRGAPFSTKLLREVAAVTQRGLRQIDVVTRFGIDELAALLPNTHFAGALVCAERLVRALAALRVDDETIRPTMGIAFFPGKDVVEPADLLRLAQRALDRAREEGAGAICLVQHQGYLFTPR
jgi:diguanylate cyclase (GGDEF)-like protein